MKEKVCVALAMSLGMATSEAIISELSAAADVAMADMGIDTSNDKVARIEFKNYMTKEDNV